MGDNRYPEFLVNYRDPRSSHPTNPTYPVIGGRRRSGRAALGGKNDAPREENMQARDLARAITSSQTPRDVEIAETTLSLPLPIPFEIFLFCSNLWL